ncbi:fasciclin domain-containing protein [Streptomyces sp. NPDC059002]|uniref:fasciclin domain-containing protein n=1 Tax=Streptomyces sp. NPDC059002 TaxID=3346690 RepID=UPI0036C3CE05
MKAPSRRPARTPAARRAPGPAATLLALLTLSGCAWHGGGFPGGAVEGPRRDDKAFGPACPQVAPGTANAAALEKTSVLAAIRSMPQLSELTALVKEAKAEDMFRSMQNVTVFAPTDAAFDKLTEQRRKAIAEPGKAGDTVRSLIVAQDLTREDLAAGQAYPTLQDGVQVRSATTAGGGVAVDGAEVVCGSVTTKDARLHLLDALPAEG